MRKTFLVPTAVGLFGLVATVLCLPLRWLTAEEYLFKYSIACAAVLLSVGLFGLTRKNEKREVLFLLRQSAKLLRKTGGKENSRSVKLKTALSLTEDAEDILSESKSNRYGQEDAVKTVRSLIADLRENIKDYSEERNRQDIVSLEKIIERTEQSVN